jgi:hypothetical protein
VKCSSSATGKGVVEQFVIEMLWHGALRRVQIKRRQEATLILDGAS